MRQNGFFRMLAEQSDNQERIGSPGFGYWAYLNCQPFGFHVTIIMHNLNFVNSFLQKKFRALLKATNNKEWGYTVPVSYQAFYAYMPERVRCSQRCTRSICLFLSSFIDSKSRDRTRSGPSFALFSIICASFISPSNRDRVYPGPFTFIAVLSPNLLYFVFAMVPGITRGPLFLLRFKLLWVKINCGPDGTLILQTCCPVPSAAPPSIVTHNSGAQRPASLSPTFLEKNQTKKALNIKNTKNKKEVKMEFIKKEYVDRMTDSSAEITFYIGENKFWFKPEEISIPMSINGDTLLETLSYHGYTLKRHVGWFNLEGKDVFLISSVGIHLLDLLSLFPWAYDFFSWIRKETGPDAVFTLFKELQKKIA
jgi:hypothetical protein